MGVAVEVWWSSLVAAERGLLDVLDDVERGRVRSLERAADQGRSLVAAALLRAAVGEHLGTSPADVGVDRTCPDCGRPHGRPRIVAPGRTAPHVSVSHSGLLVVVALSPSAPVGVDVQRVADLTSDSPDKAGDEAGDGAGDEAAALRWARREAALKAAGPVGGTPVVRALRAPMAGYVAALATLTPGPPADADLVVRHWPAG